MSIVVIINPVAGGGVRSMGGRIDCARRAAADAGEPADVFVTQRRGHARELTRAARESGARLVVAWGGDGTINEVASELAFSSLSVGIVPAGSGNGLARTVGVARDPAQAMRAAIRAQPRPIDIGKIDEHLFVNIAGVGFDAYVASRFNDPGNRRRGLTGYVGIVARALATYAPVPYTITTPDARVKARAMLVTVANGTQYGNGLMIAPAARVDDGLLNLVIVEERRRMSTLLQLPRLLTGTIAQSPDCTVRLIAEATIVCETAMAMHVDGEPIAGGTTASVRVHPGGLNVAAAW